MSPQRRGDYRARHGPAIVDDMHTGPVPQWFTAVMGTGIVAVLLAPHAPSVALGVWVVAAVLLGLLATASLAHQHRWLDDVVQRHFLGAPAMGLMTVGAGALATQGPTRPVLVLAALLWTGGTVLGVWTAVVVPRLTRAAPLEDVGPWWLVAVVPPTVSATTGALLAAHLAPGPVRTAYVLVCWGLLLLSVVGTVRLLILLGRRLRRHGPGRATAAPAWLVVLGPLGQSVTAVHHLGERSGTSWLTAWVGPPVLLAALAWLVVAGLHVARSRPGPGPAWWSFTFPVATVATGAAALGWSAVAGALIVVVVLGWVAAAVGTGLVLDRRRQDRDRGLLGATA